MGMSGVALFEGFLREEKMKEEVNLEDFLLADAIISNPGVEFNSSTVNICILISLQLFFGFAECAHTHTRTH